MAQTSDGPLTSEEVAPLVIARPQVRAGAGRRAAAAALAALAAVLLVALRSRRAGSREESAGAALSAAERPPIFLAPDRMALQIARAQQLRIPPDAEADRLLEVPAADNASTTPDFSVGVGDLPGTGSPVAAEPFMMLKGFGCQNFQRIMKGDPTEGEVLETCAGKCASTSGCVGFGFQEHANCDGFSTGKDGACYLWFEKCIPVKNECWDHYGPIIPSSQTDKAVVVDETGLLPNATLADSRSSVHYPVQPGVGCANFNDILIGEVMKGETAQSCSEMCKEEAGCVGFGYQEHASCGGNGMDFSNACMLYSGACDRIDNPCWDQYGEVSDAPMLTTTTNLRHKVSLYCWAAVKMRTYEVDLIENQFKRQMGIFNWECDGKGLVTDDVFHMDSGDGRTFDAINMGPGSMDCDRTNGQSWSNTGVFKRAWQAIIDEGEYTLYDWVAKVDADSVFRPLRFKWHVDANHMGLNPDERIYFKNFMDGYPIVGAIEVTSRPVVEAMAQDPGGCGNIWVPAEDDWFHNCMEHHGARMVEDTALLQHMDYPAGNRCADPWFVTLHPYKDVSEMNHCDEAIR